TRSGIWDRAKDFIAHLSRHAYTHFTSTVFRYAIFTCPHQHTHSLLQTSGEPS
ncbi:hypothetical protein M9458_015353, partial [Cirrhinus mrigala]